MEGILAKAMNVCPLCASESSEKPGHIYSIFRIFVALMFLQHGLQKLFGAFGGIDGEGGAVELMTLIGLAGLIELVVSIAVSIGLFTRAFALLAAIEMLVAFFKAHLPNGIIPIMNKGELALLFFVAFLLIAQYGAGKWSLERSLFKREIF